MGLIGFIGLIGDAEGKSNSTPTEFYIDVDAVIRVENQSASGG